MPPNVRKQMRDDTAVAKKWAEAIIKLYNEQIKVNWSKKVKFVDYSDTLAASVVDSLSNKLQKQTFAKFDGFVNSDFEATFLGPILITAPHTTAFTVGDGSLS